MRLMILGASLGQIQAIKKAKAAGHYVVTCDYYEDAPGHLLSDEQYIVSTFDIDGVRKVAEETRVDGIMTIGTDQPVLTAAMVSEDLGLPSMISSQVALLATNKMEMKAKLNCSRIPLVPYMLYKPGLSIEKQFQDIPVVIKPIDTQGQRGIFYLEDVNEVVSYYDQVVCHSRDERILIEAYYQHDEITVSGWVHENVPYILAVTDRVTFSDKERIGICLSHELPSKHLKAHYDEIACLTHQVVKALEIENGPIYFQMFVGRDGIKINEIACRIGGAFEGVYLPKVTDIDLVAMQIEKSLGRCLPNHDIDKLKRYNVLENNQYLSVQLFFANPCKIQALTDIDRIRTLDGVLDVGYHKSVGDEISELKNATARVGYCIILADSKNELEERLLGLYKILQVKDIEGKNQIIHRPLEVEHEA